MSNNSINQRMFPSERLDYDAHFLHPGNVVCDAYERKKKLSLFWSPNFSGSEFAFHGFSFCPQESIFLFSHRKQKLASKKMELVTNPKPKTTRVALFWIMTLKIDDVFMFWIENEYHFFSYLT